MRHYLAIALLGALAVVTMPVWWWSISWGAGPFGGVLSVLILALFLRWRGVV